MKFECYLCGGIFNRIGEPCIHYNHNEMDENGEVSLCDRCSSFVMNHAKENNIVDVSIKFFECDKSLK